MILRIWGCKECLLWTWFIWGKDWLPFCWDGLWAGFSLCLVGFVQPNAYCELLACWFSMVRPTIVWYVSSFSHPGSTSHIYLLRVTYQMHACFIYWLAKSEWMKVSSVSCLSFRFLQHLSSLSNKFAKLLQIMFSNWNIYTIKLTLCVTDIQASMWLLEMLVIMFDRLSTFEHHF